MILLSESNDKCTHCESEGENKRIKIFGNSPIGIGITLCSNCEQLLSDLLVDDLEEWEC
jgi:hypothetical protein